MSWIALIAFAVLGVAAAVVLRKRIRSYIDRAQDRVTDDVVREIEETGEVRLRSDEPLDFEEIEDEEDRFWSETWDEPEEW